MNTSSTSQILQGALVLHRMGNLRAAMDGYMRVLKDDPQNADALYYVALVALQEGQHAEAIKLAQRALSFGPQARVHNLLGQAHIRLGRVQEALDSYAHAIKLQPDFADAYGNRANILSVLGHHSEALADFDRALALRPDSFEDWTNRGAALQDLDRFEEALASYERGIALRPGFAGGHYNRGNVLRDLAQLADASTNEPPDQSKFDASQAAFTKAIALDPKLADAHLGRALVHLLRGDWEAGFRDYEFRSKVGKPTFEPLPEPLWNGEPLTGLRLVLVTEQGLGDTIQMCRFAPLLAQRGDDVTILTRKSLQPLLSSLPGVRIATSADELRQDPNDKRPIRWLPLMSIAGVLGIRLDTIPAGVPYLAAEPARVATWAARLGPAGFKIGINWGAGHANDGRRRDIPLAAFAPLAALPGVRLISLQKGPPAGQIAQAAFRDKIEIVATDPNPEADFFLDTAAVMTHLDLIVTCDTSVTHLAGALARPVFTAIPAIADWRWLLGRTDSPWYPTLKIFRQHKLNDWPEALTRIAEAARAMR